MNALHNVGVPHKVPTPKPPPPPPPLPPQNAFISKSRATSSNASSYRQNNSTNYWQAPPSDLHDHHHSSDDAERESAIYAEIGKSSREISRDHGCGDDVSSKPRRALAHNFSVHLNPLDTDEDIYTHV